MRRILVLFMAAMLLLAGCSQYKDVDFEEIKIGKVRMVSSQEFDLQFKASVNNPTGTTFEVTSIDGIMLRNGAPFANLKLVENAAVPSRSNSEVILKCRFSLTDPLAALALGLNMASLNSDDFTVDLTATIKGGMLKKSFRYKNVPMSRIFKEFDIKL